MYALADFVNEFPKLNPQEYQIFEGKKNPEIHRINEFRDAIGCEKKRLFHGLKVLKSYLK